MNQQEYRCICGRVFDNKFSIKGHHSHCTQYLSSVGRLHIRQQIDATNGLKSGKKLRETALLRKELENAVWIAEKHTCERCGKVLTEKLGSGRFCSVQCQHSRVHSLQTRQKIALSVKTSVKCKQGNSLYKSKFRIQYELSPKHCIVCHSCIPYKNRTRKTCSEECYRKLLSENSSNLAKERGGNINKHGVRGTAKYGFYKGIHCDSSWELAYVVYNLANGVTITRNTTGFPYMYNGRKHLYFPDFIVNGVYIEIKNYWTPEVDTKMKQFPDDKEYSILYFQDIKHCITYCQEKFGKDFWKSLYDKDKPSCNS